MAQYFLAVRQRWMYGYWSGALCENVPLPSRYFDPRVHANYTTDYSPRQCSAKHTRGSSYTVILNPNQGKKKLGVPIFRCFHKQQNRYFLHDYINKHISTGDLLHSLPNCPASSGPRCSCFKGFQSIILPDSWTTCLFTHSPGLYCYEIMLCVYSYCWKMTETK